MVQILRAVPEQAEMLRQLARTSKQHWGYSPDFMQRWNHDQTLTAEFIAENLVYYAVDALAPAGFYALDRRSQPVELMHLWVDPGYIGKGIGKQLFVHLVTVLQQADWPLCLIVAEPHAEGFYRRMGAVKIGEKPMPHLGQKLPIMELKLNENS